MRSSRGRRPDPGPPVSAHPSREAVVAWLLRINRIYGRDPDLAVASRFAKVFTAGPDRGQASESRVSRWEHAALRVTPEIIRGYEAALGLPDGQITAVAHTVYRESLGRLGPPALRGHTDPRDDAARDNLRRLLERALGGDLMSGRDWDDLSAGLWQIPVLLFPGAMWARLADRLLAETLIAEGTAWLYRCEAINRLLGHHDGTLAVIQACAAVIEGRRSQVLIEPMALLELTPHPTAARQLLRQIEGADSPHALRAAWWAVAEKAGRGHFLPEQTDRLLRISAETLQDNGSHLACRLAAAETVRQLLPTTTGAARRALGKLAASDSMAGHVIHSGTTCAHATVEAVAHKLSGATLSMMRQEILRSDPILERFVTELLFHPQGTRRVVAAQTIAATPYRSALATAIGHELGHSTTLRNPPLAVALVQALGHLGGPVETALVQRLSLNQALPSPISEAAAWVAGHMRARADDPFWAKASDRLGREGGDRGGAPRCHAKALVYSLGTAGRNEHLARLAAAPELHPDLRAAAAWWLSIPGSVKSSAAL